MKKGFLKRVVSMLMVAAMMITMLPAEVYAATGVTIHFGNAKNWSKVNAYVWTGSSTTQNGSWPGGAISASGTYHDYYTYKNTSFTGNSINVIFNNGSEQTNDITLDLSSSREWWIVPKGQWSKYTYIASTTPILSPHVDGKTVTFNYASDSATSVYFMSDATTWDTSTDKMTEKNDLFTYTNTFEPGAYGYKFYVNTSSGGSYQQDPLNNNYNGDNSKFIVTGFKNAIAACKLGEATALPSTLTGVNSSGTTSAVSVTYTAKAEDADYITISGSTVTVAKNYPSDKLILDVKGTVGGVAVTDEFTLALYEEPYIYTVYAYSANASRMSLANSALYIWDPVENTLAGKDYAFTETEVLEDGKTWLKTELELTCSDLGFIFKSAGKWASEGGWQTADMFFTNTEEKDCTLYIIDGASKIYESLLFLDQTTASVEEGQTVTLAATVVPEGTELTWASSNNAIATVDENGVVTTITPGKVTITATTPDGATASCVVTVTEKERVSLDRETLTIKEDETATLVATATPAGTIVEWTSDNEDVATVDANGVVTAVSIGEAVITVTTPDGASASCTVTVTEKERVSLDREELTIKEDETATLVATASPAGTTVEWTSDNEDVATVDTNGVVTAVGIGEAVITVTTPDGASASCAITVTEKERVSLDKTELTLEEEQTAALVATATPAGTTVEWTSDNEDVATVDVNGVVTAVAPGEATITATTPDGASASCMVTVKAKEFVIEEGVLVKYQGDATHVVVPDEVTTIGEHAFEGCETVLSIELPENLTTIADHAFRACRNLEEVAIPESVTTVGGYAFWNCNRLVEITLPEGITEIGKYTFYNCYNLQKVEIPARVTTIGDSAFYNCMSLQEIELPDSVTKIAYYAFVGCSSLQEIEIPAGVTTINISLFDGCSSLEKVELPAGVTIIQDRAFFGCSSLQEIEIPAGITTIGRSVFNGCSSLQEIEIPVGVTTIDAKAFWNCSSLEKIVIPKSVTSISEDAFSDTERMTIYGTKDTYVEQYATEQGINFVAIEVNLDMSEVSIREGETVTLVATTTFEGTEVTWSSDNEEVAIVDENGVVTAVAPGEATITATTSDGESASCTVTVTEKLVEYTVTFDVDGETTSVTVVEGEKVAKPENPSKEGYNFTGWTLDGSAYDFEEVVTEDITLVATWEIKEFTVTFDVDGETTTETVAYGETVTRPDPDPVKEGYNFIGWYVGEEAYDFETEVTTDLTITAKFEEIVVPDPEPVEYTVTFVVDGETTIVTVAEGEKVTKPEPDPVKEGYNFIGWYVGEEAYDFETEVTTDLTITAKFEEIVVPDPEPVEYTITFVVDGETTIVTVVEGEKVTRPDPDPVKEGYNFIGWYVGEEAYDFEAEVTTDLTITAKFEEIVVEYTVTFVVDGEMTTVTVEEGEKVSKPKDPSKEGYDFTGWTLDGNAYDFEEVVTGNITLVATWEIKEFTVTFDVDGETTTETVAYGETVVKPEDPEKEGYNFVGWYVGEEAYDFDTEVTTDLTITAKFEEIVVPDPDPTPDPDPVPPTQEEQVRSFVERMYTIILGRDADPNGLNDWAAGLIEWRVDGAGIVNGFANSEEFEARNLSDEDFIKTLYLAVLNREADEAGLADWLRAFSLGYTRQMLIDGFVTSAEFIALCDSYGILAEITQKHLVTSFVERMYTVALDREADAAGLEYWVTKLMAGSTDGKTVVNGFVGSPEFEARGLSDEDFIKTLYRTILGREASDADVASWIAAIELGQTRTQIMNGFIESAEFAYLCDGYGISAILTQRDLVTNFVERMYTVALGREADENGLNDWVTGLIDGVIYGAQVADGFIMSAEFEARGLSNEDYIKTLYLTFFNREAGDADVEGWVAAMTVHGQSRRDVLRGFINAEEFRVLCEDYGIIRGEL